MWVGGGGVVGGGRATLGNTPQKLTHSRTNQLPAPHSPLPRSPILTPRSPLPAPRSLHPTPCPHFPLLTGHPQCHALEFSSRIRFQEWMDVVKILCADSDLVPGALCPERQLSYDDGALVFAMAP